MIQLPAALAPHAALIKRAAVAVAALALFGAGVAAGKRWSAAELERERVVHVKAVAAAESAARQAVEQARAREATIVARTEEIVRDAVAEEERLRAARADTVAESVRLRDAAAAYQRRRAAACVAASASRGSSGAVPDDMRDGDRLLRVFGECEAAHGALADDLGKSRADGLRCERAWDAARAELSR